jgi:hypothetical protein
LRDYTIVDLIVACWLLLVGVFYVAVAVVAVAAADPIQYNSSARSTFWLFSPFFSIFARIEIALLPRANLKMYWNLR